MPNINHSYPHKASFKLIAFTTASLKFVAVDAVSIKAIEFGALLQTSQPMTYNLAVNPQYDAYAVLVALQEYARQIDIEQEN